MRRVQRVGQRRRGRQLNIWWATGELAGARLGLIVPRHGHTAVARNRLQRRLRELWRREVQMHLAGCDVVVRATPAGYGSELAELREELVVWLHSLP